MGKGTRGIDMIQSKVMYKVVEEPGDVTRYTHLIEIDKSLAFIYRDINGNGAGLRKPAYINLVEVAEIGMELDRMTPNDAVNYLADNFNILGSIDVKRENMFTVASAIRCAYAVIRNEV